MNPTASTLKPGRARLVAALAFVACGCAAVDDIEHTAVDPDRPLQPETSPDCMPAPGCDAPPPAPPQRLEWEHWESTIVATGAPRHRGHDLLLQVGDPQWVIAKFAYGVPDDDLKGEQVELYLDPYCQGQWQWLGSARTTFDDEHPSVENVPDSGGRVYFPLDPEHPLGIGRHRVHLVVRGDLTFTDALIEVVPPHTVAFISDVDGTLTSSEAADWFALLVGTLPTAHPDAASALGILARKGYRPFYVTARPEYLTERTRRFLEANGFPPGTVHTTQSVTGAVGEAAVAYKSAELDWLASKGIAAEFAFGNTATDAQAYANGGVPCSQRYFMQYDDEAHGGQRIDAYGELLDELNALDSVEESCP